MWLPAGEAFSKEEGRTPKKGDAVCLAAGKAHERLRAGRRYTVRNVGGFGDIGLSDAATGEEIEAFFFGRALEKMKDDEATMLKNTFAEYATASVAWNARKKAEAAHGALQRRMVKKNPLVPIFTSAVHGLNGN